MSDIPTITTEIFVAYSQCPRKAFLLLFSEDRGKPHDYPLVLEKRRQSNRAQYLEKFRKGHPEARQYEPNAFKKHTFLVEATLWSKPLEAYCAVLTETNSDETSRRRSYEPTIVTGTYSITPEQKTELLFVGSVLGEIQKQEPTVGRIVGMDGKTHRVQLESNYKSIKRSLKILESWCRKTSTEPPTLILNKHCSSCQFQEMCRKQAEKDNNLSLLARMTPKEIKKYNKRGIFTIQQLSYLFKPRRKRKKRKNPEPVKHNLALQALAIREKKIYIQELPELNRQPVELFLDIEGIPDQRFYYLIGLLICERRCCTQFSFWADKLEDEETIWKQLLAKINEYPDVPIYHYGSYEIKALSELAKRYTTDIETVSKRLNNVISYIYGKIYFPTLSNKLKEIGLLIGASWASPNSSGLQSLAWRYTWEEDTSREHKTELLVYNSRDCSALKTLLDKLSEISSQENLNSEIAFANQKRKLSTEVGEEIHDGLELILKSSHADYNKNKISFRNTKTDKQSQETKQKGHGGVVRVAPSKITNRIEVPPVQECSQCGQQLASLSKKTINIIIIDLRFINSGAKKTISLYESFKSYCKTCKKYFKPDVFYSGHGNYVFGHGFRSWAVYQRLVLRLPFRLIAQNSLELFDEPITPGSISNIIKYFSDKYGDSEKILLSKILSSPFIHVDETQISIRGINQYVWTFTDGNHVIFRLTETRESDIVHEILHGYDGVLVSDFYGGYDAVPCKQQKCWVHLIRDLNDDLWESPFDTEYESFVLKVKELIFPIFETIDRYGLKKRYLRKFRKETERFYKNNIRDGDFKSELATKFQKRFERYKEGLFTFLEHDSIPWHNNTAERALRHIAVQRKISGSFYESGAASYLTLLGIMQTCRFQEKSFLKFLISGKKDVDAFKSPKKRKRKKAVASDISAAD